MFFLWSQIWIENCTFPFNISKLPPSSLRGKRVKRLLLMLNRFVNELLHQISCFWGIFVHQYWYCPCVQEWYFALILKMKLNWIKKYRPKANVRFNMNAKVLKFLKEHCTYYVFIESGYCYIGCTITFLFSVTDRLRFLQQISQILKTFMP